MFGILANQRATPNFALKSRVEHFSNVGEAFNMNLNFPIPI